MPLETITFKNKEYPKLQTIGGAALWVREFAKHYCNGIGLDIGYYKEKWMLPGAIGIEPSIDPEYHAMNLPKGDFDYIHSSHCLEHVKENWHNVLDYWLTKIKIGGVIFLYLPHRSQEYWLPENNRKHVHSFEGSEIEDYLLSLGHKVILSGVDLNNSFVLVCEKVIINDKPLPLTEEQKKDFVNNFKYNTLDANGDVLMPGCFDKSINDTAKYHLKHDIDNFTDSIKEDRIKIEKKPYIDNFEHSNKERASLGLSIHTYDEFINWMGL